MSGKITTKDFEIHSYEVDNNYYLTAESLLSYFQDVAMVQSDELGVGNEYLCREGLAWVLIDYSVDVTKYPKYKDKIKVITTPTSFSKLFGYRDFVVCNEMGEKMIVAKTKWTLVDTKKRKLKRINEEICKIYGVNCVNDRKIKFEKLIIPENDSIVKSYTPLYRDIDFNNHLNNKCYITWAVDTIPLKIVKSYELYRFKITYKKEIKYGEHVNVITDIIDINEDKKGLHKIVKNDGDVVCILHTCWKLR
ncbi:MAG: acyl-[acyl-carrier-protein] thioesterase [Eubacteriaceae bacterium]